jgi:hypothetical protein
VFCADINPDAAEETVGIIRSEGEPRSRRVCSSCAVTGITSRNLSLARLLNSKDQNRMLVTACKRRNFVSVALSAQSLVLPSHLSPY